MFKIRQVKTKRFLDIYAESTSSRKHAALMVKGSARSELCFYHPNLFSASHLQYQFIPLVTLITTLNGMAKRSG